jgi:hypothetical protein
MWSSSAVTAPLASSLARITAISQGGRGGKPSSARNTRIPGRSAVSGSTETASPDSTAAAKTCEFQLV